MPRETVEQRARLAEEALRIYEEPTSVRDTADQLGISYGKAYALIKEAAGTQTVFRPRGTRARRRSEERA